MFFFCKLFHIIAVSIGIVQSFVGSVGRKTVTQILCRRWTPTQLFRPESLQNGIFYQLTDRFSSLVSLAVCAIRQLCLLKNKWNWKRSLQMTTCITESPGPIHSASIFLKVIDLTPNMTFLLTENCSNKRLLFSPYMLQCIPKNLLVFVILFSESIRFRESKHHNCLWHSYTLLHMLIQEFYYVLKSTVTKICCTRRKLIH